MYNRVEVSVVRPILKVKPKVHGKPQDVEDARYVGHSTEESYRFPSDWPYGLQAAAGRGGHGVGGGGRAGSGSGQSTQPVGA